MPSPTETEHTPRSRVEKAALLLTTTTLVVFVVSCLLLTLEEASTAPPWLSVPRTFLTWLANTPIGWLLLVGVTQLLRRRPTSAVVAAAGGDVIGGLVVSVTQAVDILLHPSPADPSSPQSLGLVRGQVASHLILWILLLVTAVVTARAGAQGPRPRPASVSVALGSALFLLARAAISTVVALVPTNPDPVMPGGRRAVGPLLAPMTTHSNPSDEIGLDLPWPGLVVLLATLALATVTLLATQRRDYRRFRASVLAGAGLYLAFNLLVVGRTVTRASSPHSDLLIPPVFLAVYLLCALLLVIMASASTARSARQWFRSHDPASPATTSPATTSWSRQPAPPAGSAPQDRSA